MYNLLTSGNGGNGSSTMITVVFIVIIVAMIGLLIWQTISGKKKQKEAQEMLNQLKIGDRVKTIGGVCGFVAEINDAENTFVLETGAEDKKSYVKFDKGAIYQTAPAQGSAVAQEETKAGDTAETIAEEPVATAEEKPAKKTRKKKADVE